MWQSILSYLAAGPGLFALPCLPTDERILRGFEEPKGRLSNNTYIETILQNLLLFGPPVFLLLCAPLRFFQLYGAKLVTVPNYRGLVKLLFSSIFVALQLVCVATVVAGTSGATLFAFQLLSLVASSALCALSFLEHGRSVAPSTILTVYLAWSAFADIIHFGLLYVAMNLCSPSLLALAIFSAKLVLLTLEAQDKTLVLRKPYQSLAPEERAGFFGNAFFRRVNDIISLGYHGIISLQDMPPLASNINALKLREDIQEAWNTRTRPEHRFCLYWVQFKCLWRRNIDVVLPRILFIGCLYSQPLLISRIITYVSSNLTPLEDRNEAFRLVLLTFLIYMGMAVFKGMYYIRMDRLSISNRMSMVGLIHNRCMTIRDGVFDDSVAVTLMSNDAEGVQFSGFIFHEIWAQVIELGIGVYFLAIELGWVCLLPLLMVALTSQGSKFVTGHIADRQKALSMATQTRISIIKAILDSMKNIKMMGLVEKMTAKIENAREHEIKMAINFRWLIVAFNASASILKIFSPIFTLVIYAVQAQLRGERSIDANLVFTSLAMINLVTSPANSLLVLVPNMASFIARFDRIQKYLVGPDRQDTREKFSKPKVQAEYTEGNDSHHHHSDNSEVPPHKPKDIDVAISISGMTLRPAPTANPVLNNIDMIIKKGCLAVFLGAVGTGKTTLAKALLGDLSPDTGMIKTAFHSIAYCAQTAWLTNGTIQSIICSGDDHKPDRAWYERVVHACDLEDDLLHLPNGDQTVVGSRGIALSGGQKQRVALARAVYARRDMIILDDVLSALDSTTEAHIFENLLGSNGLFKELGTTVLLNTHSTQYLPQADYILVLGENGNILEQGTWGDLRSSAGYIGQIVLRETKHESQKRDDRGHSRLLTQTLAEASDNSLENVARKIGDITLYGYYFSAIGLQKLLALFVSLAINVTIDALSPYWLRFWADSGGQGLVHFSGVYFFLGIGAQIASLVTIYNVFLIISPHSSKTLHKGLLDTVMQAPQSYFATTDTGITLNRFTSDISMIDSQLPPSLLSVSQFLFQLLSQCILLGAVQPLMVLTLPFTLAVLYIVQKVYLAVSRQARFLDLESKALVNSSFLETLEGIPTIRAFGWQRLFVKDNAKKLDLTMRALYLLMCIQRWLNMVLDLTVLALSMLVVVFSIGFKGTITGGLTGIALNIVLQANVLLLGLVESWTHLETSLGAISRLRAFGRDVQPENKPGETTYPPPEWPAHGAISFDSMSAGYNYNSTLVLHSLTVSIEAGKKVGVCGRTGSGKSSLLLSLLRLIEIELGTIQVDNIDLQTLPRSIVRSRIITVPQDPMLVMTDTVRQNLDISSSAASDNDIIYALKKVKLWPVFQARANGAEIVDMQARDLELEMGGGARTPLPAIRNPEADSQQLHVSRTTSLDATMKSLPLSKGQQQLFSLARAILMRPTRGNIVLLDEATSSVDTWTDNIIQQVIKEEFKDYTVITVAHRLETIMDSDFVLVLDAGRIVEIGAPSELVQKEEGLFKKLYGNGHGL